MSIRYSLFINQYTINENAYRFWNNIKEQNEEAAELYSRHPYRILGNVFNVDDKDELVLGFFRVAGITQKRIYVHRQELSVKMYYPVYQLTENDYQAYGFMFLGGRDASGLFCITEDEFGNRTLPNQVCIDCTYKGTSLDKPDFWED